MSYEYLNLLCVGCFSQMHTSGRFCPKCGYDNASQAQHSYQLPPRTILGGKYMLGKVLGEGGFGITYIAYDLNIDVVVAVKEYYPSGLVTRTTSESMTVRIFGGEYADFFRKGRDRFVDEAKRLTRLRALPGIVMVNDFLVENGTAYIVMEFVKGQTLKSYMMQMGGKLPPKQVFDMLGPVFGSLAQIHESGIIHRDISLDNIMITPDGSVKLLDFGAAREFDEKEKKSLSVLLKHGYAPMEQYSTKGIQGPFTDVYALSATIYKAITGVTPEGSMDRVIEDTLEPPGRLGVVLPHYQEVALMKGLAVHKADRYQTVSELQAALYGDVLTGVPGAQEVSSPVNNSTDVHQTPGGAFDGSPYPEAPLLPDEPLSPDMPPPYAPPPLYALPPPDRTQKSNKAALIAVIVIITVIAIIAVLVIGIVIWIILSGTTTTSPPAPGPVSPVPTAISTTEEPPLAEVPPITKEPPPAPESQSPPLQTVTDSEWMQLYFEEMRAALDNIGSINPESYYTGGRYPSYLEEFMLIDLNFDGVPELIIFGDGAGANKGMHIFSISETGVEVIYEGWIGEWNRESYMSDFDWQLYRKSDDGSLAFFVFFGGVEDQYEFLGDILLTDSSTRMEYGFDESAKIAEIYDVGDLDDLGDPIFVESYNISWFFDGVEVSESEYHRLINSLLNGYEHIPYTPHVIQVHSYPESRNTAITDNDLWDFMNDYLDFKKRVDWFPAVD